jgi:hypothetical protein
LEILREQVEISRASWLEGRRPYLTVPASEVISASDGWDVRLRLVNLGAPAAWVAVSLVRHPVDDDWAEASPRAVSEEVELPSLLQSGCEALVDLHVSRSAVAESSAETGRHADLVTEAYVVTVRPRLAFYGVDQLEYPTGRHHPETKISSHRVHLV